MRGKQSIKKGIWHIRGKYKKDEKENKKVVQFQSDF